MTTHQLDQDALDAQTEGRGASRWLTWAVLAIALALGAACSCGCKHWPPTWPPVEPTPEVDAVAYADLRWTYGGFRPSASDAIVARIDGLRLDGRNLYYAWADGGCERFGATNRDDWTKTICAFFWQDEAGQWVGGKFDWISTSRLSRGMSHVIGPGFYGNWAGANIPNPAEVAFVIVGSDHSSGGRPTGKRSNVVKATWRR